MQYNAIVHPCFSYDSDSEPIFRRVMASFPASARVPVRVAGPLRTLRPKVSLEKDRSKRNGWRMAGTAVAASVHRCVVRANGKPTAMEGASDGCPRRTCGIPSALKDDPVASWSWAIAGISESYLDGAFASIHTMCLSGFKGVPSEQ